MRAAEEDYKGIVFIRISNLPVDQQEKIKSSLASDHIIKILKDGNLLEDCIQYTDYLAWFDQHMAGSVYKANQSQPQGVFTLLPR